MRYTLLILASFFPVFALAQDSLTIEEIVVTGRRFETSLMESGRNVQVLTRRQIERLPVQSFTELLQYIPGLDLRQRGAFGAQADLSLRGGGFDQTLLLLNGVKLNDPQTGHHNLNLGIDLAAIQQIEIIKGPAAARYGLNAFSGVINIITRPAAEPGGQVELTAGRAAASQLPDDFYGGYQLRGAANLQTGQARHLLAAGYTQSTGYRPNTDLDRLQLLQQSVLPTDWGEFHLMSALTQNAFGASGFYAFPIDTSSEESVETGLLALQHRLQRGAFSINSQIYYRRNQDTYTLFREDPSIFQNHHTTQVGGAEVQGAWTYGSGTLGAGLEWRREAISSNNLGERSRDNLGLFLENRLWLLQDRLGFNAGLYLNHSNVFGTQLFPALDLSYLASPSLTLFAGWGRSFRVPTFTDLYYNGPTNIGNPALRPERVTNYELGLKWRRGAHFAQFSGFVQESSELIDWVRATEAEPWQPQNYEQLRTPGLEVNYELRSGRELLPKLRWELARAGYTWLDSRLTSEGEVLSRYALNHLKHQLVLQSVFSFRKNLSLTLSARYLERRAYRAYWLADARLQYRAETYTLWADLANALDTDYVEAGQAPLPGRWLRVGVQLGTSP